MELFTVGIDLGKTTFHLVGMNHRGEVLVRKRFSRLQLLHFTANLKVDLIGMEACGGWKAWKAIEPVSHPSHSLGKSLRDYHVTSTATGLDQRWERSHYQ